MNDICIIGAGVSGLVMCKTLKEKGIHNFDCFEKGSKIGGNWRFDNDNGLSSIYQSLHINSSKKMTAFSDFPMSENYPHYPSHHQVLRYLEDYCNQHKLFENIKFNTTITQITQNNENEYIVEFNDTKKIYKQVIIASGHHWKPNFPDDAKTKLFTGEIVHTHDYRIPNPFENKNVLVVGIGNSALDIACDIARHTHREVYISTRSSAYIFPHYFLGKPIGDVGSKSPFWMPLWIKRLITHLILFIARGKQSNYGIPKPKFKILTQHPTISSEIFNLAGKGLIKFKPEIKSVLDQEVTFEDRTEINIDTIIFATGYNISIPFIDSKIIDIHRLALYNELSLYKRIIPLNHKNIFLLGYIQPNASIFKMVELQSLWIAQVIADKITLPNKDVMKKEITNYEKMKKIKYQDTKRHSIQVDANEYIKILKEDINE